MSHICIGIQHMYKIYIIYWHSSNCIQTKFIVCTLHSRIVIVFRHIEIRNYIVYPRFIQNIKKLFTLRHVYKRFTFNVFQKLCSISCFLSFINVFKMYILIDNLVRKWRDSQNSWIRVLSTFHETKWFLEKIFG